jgi:chemotaxis protein methyltransferase CheR
MSAEDKTDIEIEELLKVIYQEFGYDFFDYSPAHVKRRILNRLRLDGISGIPSMCDKVLKDKNFTVRLLQDLSITVTEMFRNPEFYVSLRQNVIPVLKTYPFFRIWHAGCATGEEVYSMAIMLKEEGILQRATIYATDFNPMALETAKEGVYFKKLLKDYTYNYAKAGGKGKLTDYFIQEDEFIKMNSDLKRNVVWANHNLVTDSVFSSVHLIMCRNVLIYFNRNLQNRVLKLFNDSLIEGGFLCLGLKENLKFSESVRHLKDIDAKYKIYKKPVK